jgi:hypothetical protein
MFGSFESFEDFEGSEYFESFKSSNLHTNLETGSPTVGKVISKEEAEALACPRILSPVQQELMDWNHRLYHLSFLKIFVSPKKGICRRVYLNARVRYPFALHVSLGQHIDILGACVVRPLGLSIGRSIYFRVTVYPSIRSCLPNQDSFPRCLAFLLVAAFGDVLHSVIM